MCAMVDSTTESQSEALVVSCGICTGVIRPEIWRSGLEVALRRTATADPGGTYRSARSFKRFVFIRTGPTNGRR